MTSRVLRSLALSFGALVVVMFGVAAFLLNTYQPAPVDPARAAPPSEKIPDGSVTVRYTGTATLVFSDGETFFSEASYRERAWLSFSGFVTRRGSLYASTSSV